MTNSFVVSRTVFRGFLSFEALKDHLMKAEVDKHPLLTTAYLCGQYAYYSATSMDSVNKRTFKSELKLLRESGVTFDQEEALSHAEHLAKMLNNDSAKLAWY